VSDPQRTPHPEEPAEGLDTDTDTDTGTDAGEADTSGRTPHPEEPAEGGDPTSGSGADTPG
jgi:hypothetical protein